MCRLLLTFTSAFRNWGGMWLASNSNSLLDQLVVVAFVVCWQLSPGSAVWEDLEMGRHPFPLEGPTV